MACRAGTLLPALVVLSACASSSAPPKAAPAASPRRLEGTSWALATLDGRPVPPEVTASIDLRDEAGGLQVTFRRVP